MTMPSGTFQTGDGLINIAANKQEQFEAVCQIVGRADLIADVRFTHRQGRLQRRFELKGILEDAMQSKSASEWQRLLNDAGVPAGQVLTVRQALEHPQIAKRGLLGTFDSVPGAEDGIQLLRTGIKMDGEPLIVASV